MKSIFCRLLLLSLFVPGVIHAQVPQPSGQPLDDDHSFHPGQFYTIHHNVSLVVLDGVAVDKQGNVVTDIKQSEFHVTEDGAPQTTRNFEEAGKYTPPPTVTIDSTADLTRLAPHAPVNIILLDEFTTRFEDMAYARYSLQQWLKHQPAKLDTPTILIAVSLQHFEVLRDYTQSKDELVKALNNHFAKNPWHMSQVTWNNDMYANAHLALRRVAAATRSHQAPKTMIWIGRGFPSIGHQSTDLSDSMTQHTLDELRDARVALYTIDPAGIMVNPEFKYPTAAKAAMKGGIVSAFGGDPRFEAIAEATGGRAFSNRNDVDAEIGTSIRDGASVYTLTYIPPNPDFDKHKPRHILVTIDRPGVTFITRKGYRSDSKQESVGDDGGVSKRLAGEMLAAGDSNMQYDAVAFKATAPVQGANAIHIQVSPGSYGFVTPSDESKPRHARFMVLAVTFDKNGKELARKGAAYDLKAPDQTRHGAGAKVPAELDISLEPNANAVRARLVVREEFRGTMGTVDLPLTAGATASTAGVSNATSTSETQPAPAQKPPAS